MAKSRGIKFGAFRVPFQQLLMLLLMLTAGDALAERYITLQNDDGSIEVVPAAGPSDSGSSGNPSLSAGPAASELDEDPGLEDSSPPPPVDSGERSAFVPDDSFIDAEKLQADDFEMARPQKFYTYIDETGLMRSRPIEPAAKAATREEPSGSLGRQVIAEEQWLRPRDSPNAADPEAARILGLADPPAGRQIDRFAESCCLDLLSRMKKLGYPVDELDESGGIVLNVARDEADFLFNTGRSQFRVIDLARLDSAERLRLRTFASASVHSRPGLIYPAVLTLDGNWTPVRLLNDIVYAYGPESWFRHAYLEGFFDVDPAKERFIVVFSTRGDQSRKSVVYPTSKGPQIIEHTRFGTIELSPTGPPPA